MADCHRSCTAKPGEVFRKYTFDAEVWHLLEQEPALVVGMLLTGPPASSSPFPYNDARKFEFCLKKAEQELKKERLRDRRGLMASKASERRRKRRSCAAALTVSRRASCALDFYARTRDGEHSVYCDQHSYRQVFFMFTFI